MPQALQFRNTYKMPLNFFSNSGLFCAEKEMTLGKEKIAEVPQNNNNKI